MCVSCLRLLLSSLAGFLAFVTTSLQSSNSSSDPPESLTLVAEAVEAALELLLLITFAGGSAVTHYRYHMTRLELSLRVSSALLLKFILLSTPSVKIGSRSKYKAAN